MKSIFITFSGIDGAGKSTQIEKLEEYLLAEGFAVRRLAFWDQVAMFRGLRTGFSKRVLQSDGAVGTVEKPAKRNDKNAQSWPLLFGRTVLHLVDVVSLWRVVNLERSRGEGIVIFDRYIYDQLAALPLQRWWARAYAQFLLRIAPKPDISYLVDAVPEDARARKPEYPLEFMHQNRRSYLELRTMAGMELIPAGNPQDVHLAIVERFHQRALLSVSQPEVSSAVVA